ncbi:unnamed protein product [Orchesella dallaii]|uniref:Protein kinase domain-containing protein n=1 Tax=Orchesella dallaii TaxID=48710 RepID=A0ABP1R1B5_9HEXA
MLGFNAPELEAQANEQIIEKPECTFASDVYSLGCMFYYVLTGGEIDFGDLKNIDNLDAEILKSVEHIDAQCVNDIVLIKKMISDNPMSRPSCNYLLSQPTVIHSFIGHPDPNVQPNRSISLLGCIKKIKQIHWKERNAKLYEEHGQLCRRIDELITSIQADQHQQQM